MSWYLQLIFEKFRKIYTNVEREWASLVAHACNAEDSGLIPGWGRSPREANGNPLQYSSLENSMDKGASWATVHGVAKNQTQLSMHVPLFLKAIKTSYMKLTW